MTTKCELCGRPTARQALTATWFPHTLCDRRTCRAAARDSVDAVTDARDKFGELARAIAARHDTQASPVGFRDDAMAEIDVVDNEKWWANEVVKRV